MSYRKYLTRYGSPSDEGEIRITVYLTAPEKLTTQKDIVWRDKRTAEEIANIEEAMQALRDYRKALAARYGELETMPYTRRLKLERRPHMHGPIDYIVTIKRTYEDKSEVSELYEVFRGKERKKAFSRYQELLKQHPGIESEIDTEKRGWEK